MEKFFCELDVTIKHEISVTNEEIENIKKEFEFDDPDIDYAALTAKIKVMRILEGLFNDVEFNSSNTFKVGD